MPPANLLSLVLAQDEPGASWLETVQQGGVIGYLIIGLSVVALALVIMHLVQIRRGALLPPHQLETLDEMLSRSDVNSALEYCMHPENDSYLTRILLAGLTRFQKSAFGAFEVKNAIEEAGEDQTARMCSASSGRSPRCWDCWAPCSAWSGRSSRSRAAPAAITRSWPPTSVSPS